MEKYTLIARRIGLSAIISPLVTLSNIILLPILTKNLAIADYGTWALIMVTISLLPALVSLGLPNSLIRFAAAAQDKHDIREIFYSMGFVVLAVSLIVTGLLFLFAPQIAASLFQNNLTIAQLFIANILIACLIYFTLTYFVTFHQFKRYSALSIFNAYLETALVAYFILSGHGLEGAVAALLIQQVVGFSLMMYLIVAQIGFAIPKFVDVRQYLAYGVPLLPGTASNWVANSSDRYLILFFLGAAAVGYYSPAYTAGAAITMIAAPLPLLLPVLSKYYDENNVADVRTIVTHSLKYYAGIALPSVFALSVLSKPLLLVLTTQQIATNGYLVTPFVAAGAALVGAYTVFVMVIRLEKKTAVIGAIWTLAAMLNFGLNLVLIPYFGLIGAALTTFLAFLLAFVLTTFYSFRYFKFDLNGRFIVKSICASSIMALFLFLWNPLGLVSILLSIALAAVIYLSLMLALRGLTIQELKLIYGLYKGS